jgi:hypothetical protein
MEDEYGLTLGGTCGLNRRTESPQCRSAMRWVTACVPYPVEEALQLRVPARFMDASAVIKTPPLIAQP